MDKKKSRKIITTALLMTIGGGIGFLAAKLGMDSAKTTPLSQIIAIVIFFLPAFFITIAVHEAGHAIAGILMKFDFRMYVVGPFMWDKEESGWKFKWNKNVNLSGGFVICLPNNGDDLARRFSFYALGGPSASLIFAGLTYGIKHLIDANNTLPHPAWSVTAAMFGLLSFLSLFIFVLTIIPLHTEGFYTDGARALRFLKGGDTSRFEMLLMNTITSSSAGVRPSLLDKAEINEAIHLGNKLNAPMKVYLHSYLHQIALDEENFDKAEQHLKDYLEEIESIPKGIRGSVYLDAAFFYAFARKDLEEAENYWKQYEPSAILPKAQVIATEAAISSLKNEPGVHAKIDQALKEIPSMIDRGVGIALREKLEQLRKEMSMVTV